MLREENWTIFNKSGTVIYLDVTAEEVFRRLKETDDRPILKPILKLENPLEKIGELLKERNPFYARADITISSNGRSPRDIASEIVRVLMDT